MIIIDGSQNRLYGRLFHVFGVLLSDIVMFKVMIRDLELNTRLLILNGTMTMPLLNIILLRQYVFSSKNLLAFSYIALFDCPITWLTECPDFCR